MEEREEQDQGRVPAAVPGDPGTFTFEHFNLSGFGVSTGEDPGLSHAVGRMAPAPPPFYPRPIFARIRKRRSRSRRCEDTKNPSGLSRDSQVPPSKWDNLVITLIPVDVGKPTAKSEKALVTSGTCQWEKPIYETVKFVREPKTGRINEKVYHILVSATVSRGDSSYSTSSFSLEGRRLGGFLLPHLVYRGSRRQPFLEKRPSTSRATSRPSSLPLCLSHSRLLIPVLSCT